MKASPLNHREPWRFTMVVQGPLRSYNRPAAYVDVDGRCEKVNGADIAVVAYEVECERIRQGRRLVSTVLINSPGGYLEDGKSVLTAIKGFNQSGVHTVAIVDERALSFGGSIFGACQARVAKPRSRIMFHQTYERSGENNPSKKPRLSYPRELFRQKMLQWIESNIDEAHQAWAIHKARMAFADRSNFLDDVSFTGASLYEAGAVDQLARNRQELGWAYGEITQSLPESWPPQIQAFFDLKQSTVDTASPYSRSAFVRSR